MAGIDSTDANFAGWDAFCRKVFGRSNYLGDVVRDTQTAITGGTPGDWQTQHAGSVSTVKIVNRDHSIITITDVQGEALGIAVGGKAKKL